jgi:uncharacterized protein (DUF433 family)
MATATGYDHIVLDERGVPIIAGTTMKVVELVLDHLAYGWSPEELKYQHPYLTLGQVYSALGYYWDHQEEIDHDIERRRKVVEHIRRETQPTPLVKRLREQGLI